MEKQTNIIINFAIEGLHRWKDAAEKAPEVRFLEYGHRHMFHICCKKKVDHDDRDIEIILFKRNVQRYLVTKYGKFTGLTAGVENINSTPLTMSDAKIFTCCDFRGRSCEMLAEELLEHFDLEYCSVLEDNENGAEVLKTV